MKSVTSPNKGPLIGGKFWATAAFLAVLLGVFFWKSFLPGVVHFSNDGPLGALVADQLNPRAGISGQWIDLNSTGLSAGNTPVGIWSFLWMALGSVYYSKFITPICLFILGICAWFFFRRLNFSPAAAIVGAIAATLNTCFLSDACWGVAPHSTAFGMAMLAMGLVTLATNEKNLVRKWTLIALAGMAVGMNVVEAADIGAMFSVVVAVYVFVAALTESSGSVGGRAVVGVVRVVLVAAMAGFISYQSVTGLIGSSIKGISVVDKGASAQEEKDKQAENFHWATQWSLPPKETLTIAVPGLFGYRMDTANGANYWGMIGSDPSWDEYLAKGRVGPAPQGMTRFSGTLGYAGVLVLLVGAWAAAQAARKDSVYSSQERILIGFWVAVAVLSLFMSWGRFSSLYRVAYYFVPLVSKFLSVSRNPTKFLYIVNFALVILFAYGLNGLWKRYVTAPGVVWRGFFRWWQDLKGADRGWAAGCLALLAVGVIGTFLYTSSKPKLVEYLAGVGFGDNGANLTAKMIADFSIHETWIFVVLLMGAVLLMFLTLSGWFSGQRAKWFALALGAFTIIDLGHTAQPFIVHWNYREKYDLDLKNPVIDFLSDKPYEHRMAMLPFPMPDQYELLSQLYRIEWAQHHFLYHNIQSLDVIQMPRPPVDIAAFEKAWRSHGNEGLLRMWELTNLRYLLGPKDIFPVLNQQLDPVQKRFSVKLPFNIVPKPGHPRASKLDELTAVENAQGPFAIAEFGSALPRASLYANWFVNTNDTVTLSNLFSAEFNPHTSVMVADAEMKAGTSTNASAGTVEYESYKPKRIVLKANAKEHGVLLLNDRYDDNWKVSVDGQPAKLLRCNFIMRGVELSPGAHTVEFTFNLPYGALTITAAALGLTVLLIGIVVVTRPKSDEAEPPKLNRTTAA